MATEAWLMAIEGPAVIGLRLLAAAARDAKAHAETNGMIGETMLVSLTGQAKGLNGGLVPSPVRIAR